MSIHTKLGTLLGGLALSTALGAFAVQAQSDSGATLKSLDGSYTIRGNILSYDGTSYRISTNVGELIIRQEFVTCEGGGCPGANDAPASAIIVLKSLDNSIRIEGNLVALTDTAYVVSTSTGELTVRRELVTCEGDACPEDKAVNDRFAVSVPSATAADLMTAIIGEYAAAKSYSIAQTFGEGNAMADIVVGDENGSEVARVSLQNHDTATAARALLDRKTTFAITREPISTTLLSEVLGVKISDISEIFEERVIGLDAVSFAVHPTATIDVLSMATLGKILNGTITSWAQLGGRDAPINLHYLSANTSVLDLLRDQNMLEGGISSAAIAHETAADLNAAIASDPNAMAVLYRSQVKDGKLVNLEMACDIYAESSDFHIQTEEYPLSVRLYQYTLKMGVTSDFARNIGNFIGTDFGQAAIASNGLVTQELRVQSMQSQGSSRLLSSILASNGDERSMGVMRGYIKRVSGARRISTSLRFLTGSAELDRKAKEDLGRISDIVRSRDYEGHELLIFGFSDSQGSLDINLELSERRAASVRDILLERNVGYLDETTATQYGTGPIAPVGCNDTAEGRQLNRRVEVWLRPKT